MAPPIGHNKKQYRTVNSYSAEEKKRIKNAILEMHDSMTRITSEKELQKDIVEDISTALDFDPKILKKIARILFKANFKEEKENQKVFEEFYNILLTTNSEEE